MQVSKNAHMRQIEQMESEELLAQKKLRTEVIQLEDTLSQVRKEYEMLRIEFEQNLAANEQTGPINKEMRNLITSLQTHNVQLKGEVARYKRKYKEANADFLKVKRDLEEAKAEEVKAAVAAQAAAAVAQSAAAAAVQAAVLPSPLSAAAEPQESSPNAQLQDAVALAGGDPGVMAAATATEAALSSPGSSSPPAAILLKKDFGAADEASSEEDLATLTSVENVPAAVSASGSEVNLDGSGGEVGSGKVNAKVEVFLTIFLLGVYAQL